MTHTASRLPHAGMSRLPAQHCHGRLRADWGEAPPPPPPPAPPPACVQLPSAPPRPSRPPRGVVGRWGGGPPPPPAPIRASLVPGRRCLPDLFRGATGSQARSDAPHISAPPKTTGTKPRGAFPFVRPPSRRRRRVRRRRPPSRERTAATAADGGAPAAEAVVPVGAPAAPFTPLADATSAASAAAAANAPASSPAPYPLSSEPHPNALGGRRAEWTATGPYQRRSSDAADALPAAVTVGEVAQEPLHRDCRSAWYAHKLGGASSAMLGGGRGGARERWGRGGGGSRERTGAR